MAHAPQNFTVWAEIPVTDMDRSIAFYNAVFQTDLKSEDAGPNPIAMFPTEGGAGVAGHLYPGKPAGDGTGPTVHFAVPDNLEATVSRVAPAGGKILSEPEAVPIGRFVYALDPDGNSIALFEMKG